MNAIINVRIEILKSMRTVYFYSFSNTPEEDAWKKAEKWIGMKGLLEKNSNIRIFGRNVYPTENPEPHGYGFYITIMPETKVEKNVCIQLIPGGKYLVARCEGLEKMGLVWKELWKLVGEGKYKYIGETRGEHGFELGYEEHLNWYSALVENNVNAFICDLLLQLWEE